jgi:hypothetical protein
MIKQEIIWQPHPGPQTDALSYDVFELLYGGARGGGKTDAGINWLVRDTDNPLYRALVIRRNSDDLRDWFDRAGRLYSKLGATIVGNPGEIRWPSGAIIRAGHLKDENTYTKYQGHEYHRMLIEELTQIATEARYEALLASCRSTTPGLKPRVFASTNPDGVGHTWVKKRFNVTACERYYREHKEPLIDNIDGKTRTFIPARVEDNPSLMDNDPSYVKMLEAIKDPDLREAWRNGSWEIQATKGLIFGSEMAWLRSNNRIKEIPIDEWAEVDTYWDLGIGDYMVVIFFQRIQGEARIIDCYHAHNESISSVAKTLINKGYKFRNHFLPHDAKQRSMETGRTTEEFVKERLPGNVITIPRPKRKEDSVQSLKLQFNKLWIQERLITLIDALEGYKQDFDDVKGVFMQIPKHDWCSHFADALQVWAQAEEHGANLEAMPEMQDTNYDKYGLF